MQLPTIHKNGTGKVVLVGALLEASEALDLAYDALKATAPNGRDYYPQGAEAMRRATAEHVGRLERVAAVKREIDALMLAIDRIE